jgi:hypothetical protein
VGRSPNEAVNLTRSRWWFKVLVCRLEARHSSRASYLERSAGEMRIPLPVAVVCFLVALPVVVPIAAVSQILHWRRLRSAAKSSCCPVCRSPLGAGALELADAAWRAYVFELHRLSPGARLRLVRLYNAICPNCGQQLNYDVQSKAFIPLMSPQVVPSKPHLEDAPSAVGG